MTCLLHCCRGQRLPPACTICLPACLDCTSARCCRPLLPCHCITCLGPGTGPATCLRTTCTACLHRTGRASPLLHLPPYLPFFHSTWVPAWEDSSRHHHCLPSCTEGLLSWRTGTLQPPWPLPTIPAGLAYLLPGRVSATGGTNRIPAAPAARTTCTTSSPALCIPCLHATAPHCLRGDCRTLQIPHYLLGCRISGGMPGFPASLPHRRTLCHWLEDCPGLPAAS